MLGRDVRRASTRDRRALGSKDQWVLTMILLSNTLWEYKTRDKEYKGEKGRSSHTYSQCPGSYRPSNPPCNRVESDPKG